jgi:hypothetical protein
MLVESCHRLAVLVARAQAIGAHIHLLFFALIRQGAFADVGHESSIDGVHRVTTTVTIQRTFAANIASLCHKNCSFR